MSQTPRGRRERVIADCVAAFEQGNPGVIEHACAEHADLAEDIVASLGALRELRAVAEPRAPPRSPCADPGTRIGRFEVIEELGRGGMGVVYRARDRALGRDVALKVLPALLAPDSESAERFRREARVLARIRHPHVVSVLEVGQAEDAVQFFAMDLIEGLSLKKVLHRLEAKDPQQLDASDLCESLCGGEGGDSGPPPAGSYIEAVVRILAKVAEGLHEAHSLGVIHRDVKPSNILLDRAGEPHVVDFGVARTEDARTITRAGAGPGTPGYMAPEQIRGRRDEVGPGTDVFALGVTLYEALTLRRPFEGETTQSVLHDLLNRAPVRPSKRNPLINRDLETICLKALEKECSGRYPTAQALADDLRNMLALRPIRARPAGPLRRSIRVIRRNPWQVTAAAAALLAVALLGTFLVQRELEEKQSVAEARAAVARHVELRETVSDLEGRVARLRSKVGWEYLTDREIEQVASDEAQLQGMRLLLESAGGDLRAALDRAERFDSASLAVAAIRRDSMRSSEPRRPVVISGTPAGAEAFLFRYELQSELETGGDRRLVPVPCGAGGMPAFSYPLHHDGAPAFCPGDVVLTVLSVQPGAAAARAGVRRGDSILRVAGSPVEASVLVLRPAPGGAAARAGVRPFDRVLRLAWKDQRIEVHGEYDLETARRRLGPSSAGDLVEAVFSRDGEERRVRYRPPGGLEDELGLALGLPETVLRGPLPAGGVRLLLLSAGAVREVWLSGPGRSGMSVRRCAYPLPCSAENLLGELPAAGAGGLDFGVRPGPYLVLLRRDGYEDLRMPFLIERSKGERPAPALAIEARMLARGATPEGFVWVPPCAFITGGDPLAFRSAPRERYGAAELGGFWIGRSEVTIGDYMDFLNSPWARQRIAAYEHLLADPARLLRERKTEEILVPHERCDTAEGDILRLLWSRGADRRYRPDAAAWDPRWPVQGITWDAARAYCAWRSRRTKGWTFDLTTDRQWEKAARGADGRAFPWGDFFHPHYCNSRTARPTPWGPEPALRFVRDESPFGVANMAGGVLEWCTAPEDLSPAHRLLAAWKGAAFDVAGHQYFRAASQNTGIRWRAGARDGFRLVARRAARR